MRKLKIIIRYETKADLLGYLSDVERRIRDENMIPLPLESDLPFYTAMGNRNGTFFSIEKKGRKKKDDSIRNKLE